MLLVFLFACTALSVPEEEEVLPFEMEATLRPVPSAGVGSRGVWFWSSEGSPYGSLNIVGDTAAESATLAAFDAWGIGLVRGAYGDLPSTAPLLVAAWNVRLHNTGRLSELLLSGSSWVYPDLRADLWERVDRCLVSFQPSVEAAGRFDALHVDIEPQALAEWDSEDLAGNRERLSLLLDTLQETRQYLDDHGLADVPLLADVPVWWDDLPPSLGARGSVGWESVEDRDAWFDGLFSTVSGVTLMAYDRPVFSDIALGVDWEWDHYPGQVRVGLEVDIPDTWPDLDGWRAAAEAVEEVYGPGAGSDIQSWELIMGNGG